MLFAPSTAALALEVVREELRRGGVAASQRLTQVSDLFAGMADEAGDEIGDPLVPRLFSQAAEVGEQIRIGGAE